MVEDERRSWLTCLGWGCLIVVVLSALGIGGCVWLAYRGGSDARAATDAYLEMVDGGRFDEAYEKLGPEYTGDHALGEFVAFEQAARHRLGRCATWQLIGTSLNRDSSRSLAVLTYQLDCEAGVNEVVFSLEKVDGIWLIQGITYRDAEALIPRSCASCGAVLVPGAGFCASCGAAVGAPAEGAGEAPPPTEAAVE